MTSCPQGSSSQGIKFDSFYATSVFTVCAGRPVGANNPPANQLLTELALLPTYQTQPTNYTNLFTDLLTNN